MQSSVLTNSGVYIIGEIGVNHDGDVSKAFKLIDAAKRAGVNAVKFQTFKAESLVASNAPMARYQKENAFENNTQYEMLKKLELSRDDFEQIGKYCSSHNIDFISTPFGLQDLELLKDLRPKAIKIASGDITFLQLIEKASKLNCPLILSTGMSNIEECKVALSCALNSKAQEVILLHCVSSYPTPSDACNLRAIQRIAEDCNCIVGWSDHTVGLLAAPIAVALGAMVIEKHFTLNKNDYGPDHSLSLEPDELKVFVEQIRQAEKLLGQHDKQPVSIEAENRVLGRRSLYAARAIRKGKIFEDTDFTYLRPAYGISPASAHMLIGRRASYDYEPYELIKEVVKNSA